LSAEVGPRAGWRWLRRVLPWLWLCWVPASLPAGEVRQAAPGAAAVDAASLRTFNARVAELSGLAASNVAAGSDLPTGGGVQIGFWDRGLALVGHGDFGDRVRGRDLGGVDEHATHTTGTAAGAGLLDPAARGMAPAAGVWSRDWRQDLDEVWAEGAGLMVSAHPYGLTMGWAVEPSCPELPSWWGQPVARADPAFGRYGPESAQVDRVAHGAEVLMVWAAGNDRLDRGVAAGEPHYHRGDCGQLHTDFHLQEITLQYGTVGGQAVAKNALTVGAVRAVPRDELSAERIVPHDISSFGPTSDGRIKPDLVMGGEAVYSTSVESADGYSVFDGSSSASAAAAGAVAALAEHHRSLGGGYDLEPAAIKALLVQTAHEAGRDRGPDYRMGYGLLDAAAAIALIEDNAQLPADSSKIFVAHLGPGQRLEFESIEPLAADEGASFTLSWIDAPAEATPGQSSAAALVVDLDLSVHDDSGATIGWPYALDPTRPAAAATADAPNRVDNVERVDLVTGDGRVAGRLRVRVQAPEALPRGQAQRFALVASLPLARPPGIYPRAARQRLIDVPVEGGSSELSLPLGNHGRGGFDFRAYSDVPWLAVNPAAGSVNELASAQLQLSLDAVGLEAGDERLGRLWLEVDGVPQLPPVGIVARAECSPDCSGRSCGPDPRCGHSCGGCGPGEACQGGSCVTWAQGCPAARLEGDLGVGLLSGSVAGRAAGAGASCGGAAAAAASGVDFEWTAPRAGRYAFTTRGSEPATAIAVRDGSCQGAELACNADPPSVGPAVALELEAGQRVTLSASQLAGAASQRLRVDIREAPCPAHDLSSRLGFDLSVGSTEGAVDDLTPSCGREGSADVSYAFRAPQAGKYRFALHGQDYAAVLHVRAGACDGAELGCSAAADVGPVELSLAQGQEVVVTVDGYQGAEGRYALDILSLDATCAGSCSDDRPLDLCGCDGECVARGDCCVDACSACGHCACIPDCEGRSCGDDGCGGSCGSCDAAARCGAGSCEPDPCAQSPCGPCSRCGQSGCEPLPEGSACEDGDLCTVLDRCQEGECVGQARDCDDGRACTEDSCQARSGRCISTGGDACCEQGRDCVLTGVLDAATSGDAGTGSDASAAVSDGGVQARGGSSGGCGCGVAGAQGPPAAAAWLLLLLASCRTAARRASGPRRGRTCGRPHPLRRPCRARSCLDRGSPRRRRACLRCRP